MNRISLFGTVFTALVLAFTTAIQAQEEVPPRVLITNVNIFNGQDDKLVTGQSVLIEGNLIKQVGPGISADGAEVVDGGGRTLMPGLIDMHSHLAMQEGLYEGRDDWDQMAMGGMTAHVLTRLPGSGLYNSHGPGWQYARYGQGCERGPDSRSAALSERRLPDADRRACGHGCFL